jgi:Trk-type K+ transport system membrane component
VSLSGLLLTIIFFTFLTFYSAFFEVVTSCGCFGDAIPLTPWQSFSKDIVLLLMILYIYKGRSEIMPLISTERATKLDIGIHCSDIPWVWLVHL